jgi:hypothetical protein
MNQRWQSGTIFILTDSGREDEASGCFLRFYVDVMSEFGQFFIGGAFFVQRLLEQAGEIGMAQR